MRFVYQIIANAIAIKLAAIYIPGFFFTGDLISLAWVSFLLTLVNYFLKPVLKLLAGPLIFFTFGLFIIVINIVLLYVVDYFVLELAVNGIKPLFLATILLSTINVIFSIIFSKKR